jgi:hypothetical protein
VLQQNGHFIEALRLHEDVLVAKTDVLGSGHSSTLWTMTRVASTLGSLDRYDESLRLYLETLISKKINRFISGI